MSKRTEKYNDPWERDSYETGSTRPPKEHGGMVAMLLVAVILLGGLCSTLGIINLRLLQQLAEWDRQPETVYLFEEDPADAPAPNPSGAYTQEHLPHLGMYGQTVSDFDRRFYDLPRGVLVTDVTQDCSADFAGVCTGDVIVSFGGKSVSSHAELIRVLESYEPGQKVELELYRRQTQEKIRLKIVISEEKE